MKRKRLTILFFAMMTLAATPRAMNHFKIYAGSLQQQVETEWLRFLLGFGTPASSNNGSATPQSERRAAICTTPPVDALKPVVDKLYLDAKVVSPSFMSREGSLEVTFPKTQSERRVNPNEQAPVELRIAGRVREKVFLTPAPPSNPVAIYLVDRAKIAYFTSLIRSARLWDVRAVRAMEKELAGVAGAKPQDFAAIPAADQDNMVPFSGAEPDGGDLKANDESVSSEGGTR